MPRSTFPKFAFALALAASSLALPLVSGTVAAEVQSEGLAVWIPPVMLAGERYRGVVIVAETADYPREVRLVSSSPEVMVPESVDVEPGMHQGVFDIKVLRPAASTATVSAVMEGMFGQASTVLHNKEAAGSRVVRLLAFNSTSLSFARVVAMTERAAASAYSLDAANTSATLAYPAGSANVTIDSKSGYGVVDIPLVNGPNRISVFGRPGEAVTVTRMPVEPAITVNVAALSIIPAWTPEWGYQGSWVLVDVERGGKPVRGDFEVVATSSDPDVVEVEKERFICRLPCAVPVRGHSEGNSQVGVQVTGIGGGTVEISTAPPVRYLASAADLQGLASKYIAQSTGTSQFAINSTSLSSYASEKAISSAVTDGPVLGLVGHYATLSANYTTTGSAGTASSAPTAFSKVVPIVIPGVRYQMSANGAAEIQWNFFNGLMKGDSGRGTDEIRGGVQSTVLRSVPVGIGSSHAAMSSFDVQLSEPVGPAELKGELAEVIHPGTGVGLAGYLVNGTLRGYARENSGVSVAAFVPSSIEGAMLLSESQKLQVDLPPIVYPAEGFVFAAHIVQGGVLLQRVDPMYELGRADPGKAGEVQEIDSMFIHSRYVARATLSVVMNAIELSVEWPQLLKMDRPYNMTVLPSVPGAKVSVAGDVRGAASGDVVTLYPSGPEGDKKVTITASKPGWTATTVERVLPAKKYVNMTIDASDGKGNPVLTPFTIEYETVDGDRGRVDGATPYMLEVRPLASKPSLSFGAASEVENSGVNYAYRSTREGESGFTGIYERHTKLTVTGGAGSGYYPPGQAVHIEAGPDRQVLGFAMVERFSRWEYDPNSVYVRDRAARVQDVVAGDIDATLAAVYVTDFTPLAVLVLSTAAAVGVYAFREEIRTIIGAYRKGSE